MSRVPFEYAVLRVMPRVDRGEFVNVGVVLYCQAEEFIAARYELDEPRLRGLDPELDLVALRSALATVRATCLGGPGAGPAAQEPGGARFGWLTAPRSTVLQPGPVHAGMTEDPAGELERLLQILVR